MIDFIPDDLSIPDLNDICIRISENTGYGLRYVFGEVRNIRNIRGYHADASPYLCDPEGEGSKRVLEEYMKMPMTDILMEYYPKFGSSLNSKRIAVIGKRFMSLQERNMIPENAHEIGLFNDGSYTPERITLFRNSSVLAKNISSLISRSNARDTAVVVTNREIRNAIVSEISQNSKVAVDAMESMIELESIGNYLEFIEQSRHTGMLRQKDVIELYRTYGVIVPSQYGNRYLRKYAEKKDEDNAGAKELFGLMTGIEELTFGELSKRLHDVKRADKSGFRHDEKEKMKGSRKEVDDFLKRIGFFDKNVTRSNVQYLYAVVEDNEVTVGKKDCLLICSPSDIYIDRKNVIFVGLDSDWSKNLSEIKYIGDKKAEDSLNAEKFSILIQQGENRIYMSTITEYGRNTVPCNYFSPKVPGESTDDFKKVFSEVSDDSWYRKEITEGFETPEEEYEVIPWRFSKSSYSNYCDCRYRVKFRSASDFVEEDQYMGTLIHAYAEFRMHYPEIVKDEGIYHYVDLIYDLFSQISDPAMKDIDRRNIHQMLKNIDDFQDRVAKDVHEKNEIKKTSDRGSDNEVMAHEGYEEFEGEFTEVEYPVEKDSEMNQYMHGFLDLIVGNDIWDYKTGKQKDGEDAVKNMFDYNDYQPYFYLLMMLDHMKNTGIFEEPTFNLFFPKEYRGNKKAIEGGKVITFKVVDEILSFLKDPNGKFRIMVDDKMSETGNREECLKIYHEHWADIIDSLGKYFDNGFGPFSDIFDYDKETVKKEMILRISAVANIKPIIKKDNDPLHVYYLHQKLKKILPHSLYLEDDVIYIPRYILDSFYEKVKNDHREMFQRIADDTLDKDLTDPKCDKCSYRDMCTICGGDFDA